MKKILIELEKLKTLNCGFEHFCRALGTAFTEIPNEFQWIYYLPENNFHQFGKKVSYQKINPLGRYFPALNPKADLWHLLRQDSPYRPPNAKIPCVLTIHDLNFLHEKKKSPKKRIARIQKKIDRAQIITTVSQFAADEVKKYCEIGNRPIHVIHNGVDLLDINHARRPQFSLPPKFLLALGAIVPKKNFSVLLDLLEKLEKNTYLVLAGSNQHAYAAEIYEKAHRYGMTERIIMPGPVNDAEKAWLYYHCTAFFFPSIAEGFGLPPIEAMRAGKPVFLSRSTSLPEVGGSEAFYFDDFEPTHMQDVFLSGMHAYENDPEKKSRIIAWSNQFQWKTAAEQYLKVYRKILY